MPVMTGHVEGSKGNSDEVQPSWGGENTSRKKYEVESSKQGPGLQKAH